MSMLSRDGSLRAVDRVIGAAKRNPEGVLLLAAGCALLMRGIGAATHALRDHENDAPQKKTPANGRHREGKAKAADMEEEAHGLVDTARDYASNLAGRVAHSAGAAMHYADDARHAAYDRTSRVAQQTRSGAGDAMNRMLNEQPLTLALFGLAAGALLAGALPGTRLERHAFAPVGERLGETAEAARRRLKRSASKARQRMEEVAEERGLTSAGLKQAARDVADVFGSELMGEDEAPTQSRKARPSAARPKPRSSAKARKAKKSAVATVGADNSRKGTNGASASDQDTGGEPSGATGERSA